MKKIVLIFLYFTTCLSCRSQEKIDLEKINFAKNYKEILNNTKFQTDVREIVTTLPVAYTKDVKQYKFGNISFVNSKETSIKSSSVGVLINNTTKRLTCGIKIEIEDTSISNELLTYLKSQYKAPTILSRIPQKNSEGKVLGNAAYYWTLKDKTLVLVQYYEYTNNKPNISSILYSVDNQVTTSDGHKNVVSLIIRTFTP
ncbi:hypothetical protein [Pedobacter zeae]|uniref:Uncharacterized protein n=1 Tax=Pedobacter zeae TaxID=1737356 RepID=A0A7W6KCP3_9SPHI|nr:hypothetical protein [Pedobacter zeae]MBB4109304.1 hypothetical protein [Pedobacter zeae]GGH19864.1 hypothetical protein GCM10007422_44990 [Pedobacter zeae]